MPSPSILAPLPTPPLTHCVWTPGLQGIAVRKVATQANSNVALSRSGDLYTWGFGEMGQLGHGRGADEPSPALVESNELAGKAVIDAATGGQHMAVVAMERQDD